MSEGLANAIFGGNMASTLFGSGSLLAGGVHHCPCCGRVSDQAQAMATNQAANVAYNSDWQQRQAAQMMNSWSSSWSTPLPRPAGIYWRRTGGKTHTVEVVR